MAESLTKAVSASVSVDVANGLVCLIVCVFCVTAGGQLVEACSTGMIADVKHAIAIGAVVNGEDAATGLVCRGCSFRVCRA